jgi:hypothetical protein
MIELVLFILSVLTNGTDKDDNPPSNCIPDHYGPGPTDDLLERGILECQPEDCPLIDGNASSYDLLYRGWCSNLNR